MDLDRHSQRDTALTAAVSAGHVESARLIVESKRVDLSRPQQSASCPSGHRMPSDDPLTLAAKRGDVTLVDMLLCHGADPGGGSEGTCDTPLTAAAAGGHVEVIDRLLAAGAPVNGVSQWARRTALVAAAESDAPRAKDCCEILLRAGADANFVSGGVVGRRLGYGGMHAAAARMDPALIRMLVAAGADPNKRAKNTDTKEVKSRRAAAARALWGSATAGERLDNTPLHLAVAAYINETAKRRARGGERERGKEKGKDVAATNTSDEVSKGQSKSAGERAALDVIETLLECGADHSAFVVDSTPLHMAALGGACDVVDMLMRSGADVDVAAPNGCTTPLEAAARYAADIMVDYERDAMEMVTDRDGIDGRGADDDDQTDDEGVGGARKKSARNDENASGVGGPIRSTAGQTLAARSQKYADAADDDADAGYGHPTDDSTAEAALHDATGAAVAVRHLAMKWNATVTATALVGMCRAAHVDVVNCLLKAAAARHAEKKGPAPEALIKEVTRNTTSLHAAAESGCVPLARLLLEWGADIELRRPDDDATPLFLAAREGRTGMIAFLFSQGADIEALCKTADRREGHDKVTPLVEAVMSDQAAAAARLIALGADVRAPRSWMPPLLTATLRSNTTITRMLLREGADPRVGVGGMTPLGLAVMTRQSEIVKALLEWRSDAVGGAAEKDKDEKCLKKKGRGSLAKENSGAAGDHGDGDRHDASSTNENKDGASSRPATSKETAGDDLDGPTASASASGEKGKASSKKKVMKVDPDEPIDAAVLDDGDSDSGGACQCPVCQRRGADAADGLPDACVPVASGGGSRGSGGSFGPGASLMGPPGPYGVDRHLTPLAAAAKLDDAETVTALLASGADPERLSGGMPPLAHAAGKGSCAAMKALLDAGVVMESAAHLPLVRGDRRTLTPLGVAAEAGELAAVKLLLSRGADPNGPPGMGFEPPLCCAVTDPPDDEEGNPVVGVVRALIAAGADPNASKEDAQSPYSPLMVAAGAGSVAVVRELLQGGADLEHVVRVTVGDSGGPRGGPDRKCHITALLHAAYCNELDAVRFLLLRGAKLSSADREAMSLVCDHLRSKAAHGVPDAGATLSLLRHQADAEADEEDEKAEQRLREERARAAELKEERKRLRVQAAAEAEADAARKKEEEANRKAEEERVEAERLAARQRKQEEYRKEQEARKAAAAAKRAEAKAAKAAAKAAAEKEAEEEAKAQAKVMEEVRSMVADLEVKRKAADKEKEARERAEREAAIKEEEERERAEKAAEAADLERRAAKIAQDALAARGKAGVKSSVKPASATVSASTTAAAARAHLLARDEAEGFVGEPTRVSKEDAMEAASWAQSAGFFVFLCNDSTEDECYERALFGAPAKFWDTAVDHVKPGTTLILYNFAARTLSGPYEALTAPQWNEYPEAWQGGRGAPPGRRLISAFPVQVAIGPSPIMEAVTSHLGGDFRPSMGGLPLGSPDQTRRDIIVTKLRLAAKEKDVACPTAGERRRHAAIAKSRASASAVNASTPHAAPSSLSPQGKGGWAAAAARPGVSIPEPRGAEGGKGLWPELSSSAPHLNAGQVGTLKAAGAGGNDECPICFEGIEAEQCQELPCSHRAHRLCFEAWFARLEHNGETYHCPMCRKEFASKPPLSSPAKSAPGVARRVASPVGGSSAVSPRSNTASPSGSVGGGSNPVGSGKPFAVPVPISAAAPSGSPVAAAKPAKKDKKKKGKEKESVMKTIPAPIGLMNGGASPTGGVGSNLGAGTAPPHSESANDAGSARARPITPPPGFNRGGIGGTGDGVVAPRVIPAPIGAPIAAPPTTIGGGMGSNPGGGFGGLGIGSMIGGGGGLFGGDGGQGGGGADQGHAVGGGGWNPLFGGGGGTAGGLGEGGGGGAIGGHYAQPVGGGMGAGLFGGPGLFSAPAVNPYRPRQQQQQQQPPVQQQGMAPPPGFSAGQGQGGHGGFGGFGAPAGDGNVGSHSGSLGFSQAEQLFPWLS